MFNVNLRDHSYAHKSQIGIWAGLVFACNGANLVLIIKRKFICDPSTMLANFNHTANIYHDGYYLARSLALYKAIKTYLFMVLCRYCAAQTTCIAAYVCGLLMIGFNSATISNLPYSHKDTSEVSEKPLVSAIQQENLSKSILHV